MPKQTYIAPTAPVRSVPAAGIWTDQTNNVTEINVTAARSEAGPSRTAAKTARPRLIPSAKSLEIPDIVGSSPAITRVRELIRLYADEIDPVLICGESGTGKEAVARNLHALSCRSENPLVVRNVGRVDRELAGSDFFGHIRGAFTGALERRAGLFEQADGGTLHLDEIGELPFELQANLLRVIEDGIVTPLGASQPFEVNVRIVAATNRNLADAVREGRLRADLYYRLAILRIDLPPLRDRGEDSIEIAEAFLFEFSLERGRKYSFTNEARRKILCYEWPGNVRDLRNTLRRAIIHSPDDIIDCDMIDIAEICAPPPTFVVKNATELLTKYLVASALEAEQDKISAAASLTGVDREKVGQLRKTIRAAGVTASDLRAELRRTLFF